MSARRPATNANGPAFDAGRAESYYTIAAINGDVLTLQAATLWPDSNADGRASPGYDRYPNDSTAGALIRSDVTFATDVNGVSTITLTSGQNWSDASAFHQPSGGIFVGSPTDKNSNSVNQSFTFTPPDWNIPVSITLHASPNAPASGGSSAIAAIPDADGVPGSGRTHCRGIKGPLIIDGGTEEGQPILVSAVALPYEYDPAVPQPVVNPGTSPNVDILRIFDDGNSAAQPGTLTSVPTATIRASSVDADNIQGWTSRLWSSRTPSRRNETITASTITNHITGVDLRGRHHLLQYGHRRSVPRHRQRRLHHRHHAADRQRRR